MNIVSKNEKIKLHKIDLKSVEDYFLKNGYEVVRYAIVDVEDDYVTIDFSYIDDGEMKRLVNKFFRSIF